MPPRRSSRLKNKGPHQIQIPDVILINEAIEFSTEKQTTNPVNRKKTATTTRKRKSSAITKKNTRKGKSNGITTLHNSNRRPDVISLDVTFSESSDNSDVEEISTPSPPKLPKLPTKQKPNSKPSMEKYLWPSARIKDNRCTIIDSDEEIIPNYSPKSDAKDSQSNESDSEPEGDLYEINLKADQCQILKSIEEQYHAKENKLDDSENRIKLAFDKKEEHSSKTIDVDPVAKSKANCVAPLLDFSIEGIDLSSVVLKGSEEKPTTKNRKTKKALASLQAFSKRLQEDFEHNESTWNDSYVDDDIIIADDSTLSIRVCWGTNYTRHLIKKNATFLKLYQEIADKHAVSVSLVVLSFKDNVISPEERPADINLSIGDIIDGGILNKSIHKSSETESNDKDSISLKVQTANRKTVHKLYVNKYDKMSVLMEKYSKLRNIPLNKLKFKFDGETLQPTDTPSSLDLEGDECIDVFEL